MKSCNNTFTGKEPRVSIYLDLFRMLDTPSAVADTEALLMRRTDGTGVGIASSPPRHDRRRTKHSDAFSGGAWPGRAFCFFERNRVKVGAEFYC